MIGRGAIDRGAARLGLAVALVVSVGCRPGEVSSAPSPLTDSAEDGSPSPIDVRSFRARPRLTLLAREGDPEGAIAAVFATGLDGAANIGLAEVIRGRLAHHDVTVRAHRSAFRVEFAGNEQQIVALIGALAEAVARPTSGDDVPVAQAAVDALARRPLDAAELEPIARCTLDPSQRPGSARKVDAKTLERWRSHLVPEATALAAVGPRTLTEAAVEALESGPEWRATAGVVPPSPSKPPVGGQHGVYLANLGDESAQRDVARLDVVLFVADARAAVDVVQRLRPRPSPLDFQLTLTAAPAWHLVGLRAVAQPIGGCVHVAVERRLDELPEADELVDHGASVASAIARVLTGELALQGDRHAAAMQVVRAADPVEAAARAAWWTLSRARGGPPVVSSALGVNATTLPDAPEPATSYESALRAGYQPRAVDQRAHVQPRSAVESGQGQLWLMLASPCALRHEGNWDAGRSALAAISAAESSEAVEPWVSGDGIGIIAHGSPRRGESPNALARRVAREAARAVAVTAQGSAGTSFEQAHRRLLRTLGNDSWRDAGHLASVLAPNHPSWLLPMGLLDRQAAATHQQTAERWRQIVAGPMRAAVLANVNQQQVAAVGTELGRWLPATAPTCDEVAHAEPVEPGVHRVLGDGQRLYVAADFPRKETAAARLVVAALARKTSPLATLLANATWSVKVVGGIDRSAIVVEVLAPGEDLATLGKRVADALASWANASQSTLGDGFDSLMAEERQRRRRQLRDPRRRLANLWREAPASGGRPSSPAVLVQDDLEAFLTRALARDQFVIALPAG